MNYVNKLIVRVREGPAGQTMTEYVLIIAAIGWPVTSRMKASKAESTRSLLT
jgi:hypothetical protein